MKLKKVLAMLLACTVMMSGLGVYAGAVGTVESTEEMSVQRASGRFSMDISGNTLRTANQVFSWKRVKVSQSTRPIRPVLQVWISE